MRRIILSFFIILMLLVTTLMVITLGRGYRLDFGQKKLLTTGLLVASSEPTGAQVWVDDQLKTATNNTFSLPPGWYEVKILKDGYLPWQKRIRIQGEVVAETKALLFPSTPAFSPLTTSGVVAPTVSPDGSKVVYAITAQAKAGLWLLPLDSAPLGFNRDAQLLFKNSATLDFSLASFAWSPDSKQILITLGGGHYLLEPERNNQLTTLTDEAFQTLKNNWQQEEKDKQAEKLTLFPSDLARIATQSGQILAFSPDETKILYQASQAVNLPAILTPAPIATNPTPQGRSLKPGALYVYDVKEDKNFELPVASSLKDSLSWFPSSRHLVLVESDKISIMEYDGINKVTVYSGPFEKFVASLPSGAKILILTSYNRPSGSLPNLYAINLR